MLLNFRQGLVSHQLPSFFNVTFPTVDLLADASNIIVSFANGDKEYLHTEQSSVPGAWGPTILGRDQWLYWDINTRTGKRTFGITVYQPLAAHVAPTQPATDQHWFDLSTNTMNVWSGHGWIKRIRTFAFKLANGRVPVSMGPTPGSFVGTQVGNTTQIYAGHIVIDSVSDTAVRDQNGQFITTEDRLHTTAPLSSIKLAGVLVEGESQQNLAAHTIVVFSEFGKIVHATQFTAGQTQQFGIIETNAPIGSTVTVSTHGAITSSNWDWTALGVNARLYCDEHGTIVADPIIPNQAPIGVVLDRHTIQLGSPIVSIGGGDGSGSGSGGGGTTSMASDIAYGVTKLSVAPEVEGIPISVGTNDPRMSDARVPTSHIHQTSDVANLQTTLNSKVDTTDVRLSNARPPTAHNHNISQILTLQTQLDSKVDTSDARLSNARTPTSHGHTISQVLNLQTSLDEKVNLDDIRLTDARTPLSHLHPISQVLNLQASLDVKMTRTGDTMTGYLTLVGDPVNPNHAATKQYVDSHIGTGGSGGSGPGGIGLSIDFGTITTPQLSLDFGATA